MKPMMKIFCVLTIAGCVTKSPFESVDDIINHEVNVLSPHMKTYFDNVTVDAHKSFLIRAELDFYMFYLKDHYNLHNRNVLKSINVNPDARDAQKILALYIAYEVYKKYTDTDFENPVISQQSLWLTQ